IPPRTITRIDIHRREASRNAAINKPGKRVERVELVATARLERAAKERIEEIFATQRDRECFVRLSRQLLAVLSTGAGRAYFADVVSRAPREETIRDAKLDLVCISDRVDV